LSGSPWNPTATLVEDELCTLAAIVSTSVAGRGAVVGSRDLAEAIEYDFLLSDVLRTLGTVLSKTGCG
jgi:hypothetical protein